MRIMPIKVWGRKPARKRLGRPRHSGRRILAVVVVLLVASIFGIFWFTGAYFIHKTINSAALEAATAVANPDTYASPDEVLYGANVGNLSSNSVFANFVTPVLKSAHLDPKQVTKFTEQVTWLDPQNPNPQCGVIVYFQYPLTVHIPFTHVGLTLIRLKAAGEAPKKTSGAAGTCS